MTYLLTWAPDRSTAQQSTWSHPTRSTHGHPSSEATAGIRISWPLRASNVDDRSTLSHEMDVAPGRSRRHVSPGHVMNEGHLTDGRGELLCHQLADRRGRD